MSATPDNGGPAFPNRGLNNDGCTDIIAPGMTLRDWFAGQALAASDGQTLVAMKDAAEKHGLSLEQVVGSYCYSLADAMLAARNKQEGSK